MIKEITVKFSYNEFLFNKITKYFWDLNKIIEAYLFNFI